MTVRNGWLSKARPARFFIAGRSGIWKVKVMLQRFTWQMGRYTNVRIKYRNWNKKLAENNEFYIVQKGTRYGLNVYDHIILDADAVEGEGVLVYQ